jgi:hypothetical protein
VTAESRDGGGATASRAERGGRTETAAWATKEK